MKKTRTYFPKWIVGVDETGRGPVAGPVAVGVVVMSPVELKKWGRVNDSKKQSQKNREEIFKRIKKSAKARNLKYAVSFGSARMIDEKGITSAIRDSMAKALKSLKIDPKCAKVLLDGSLYAPTQYINQKTIIKGDEKETIIALASIAAKVLRDQKMCLFSKKYPKYNFEIHKGYGTKKHIQKIKKFGLSALHRRSYLRKHL